MECKIVWNGAEEYFIVQTFLNEMRKLRIVNDEWVEWVMEDIYYSEIYRG